MISNYILHFSLQLFKLRSVHYYGNFPYLKKEMAKHFVLVCQIMTFAIDAVPKARLCY
ncbi:MAG: hypothetical protein IJ242_16110 [Clostridia bacterium]|nr:hypothetical protein [Clostridia bacterium]